MENEVQLPNDIIELISIDDLNVVTDVCLGNTSWKNRCNTPYFKNQLINKYFTFQDDEYKKYLSTLNILSLIKILKLNNNYPSRIFDLSKIDDNINKFINNNIFKKYIVGRYIDNFGYDKYMNMGNYIQYNLYTLEEIQKMLLILYPDINKAQFYDNLQYNIKTIYNNNINAMNKFWYNYLYRIFLTTENKDKLIKFVNEIDIDNNILLDSSLYSNKFFVESHPLIMRKKSYESFYNTWDMLTNYWEYILHGGKIVEGTLEFEQVFYHIPLHSSNPSNIINMFIGDILSMADKDKTRHLYFFNKGYKSEGIDVTNQFDVYNWGIGYLNGKTVYREDIKNILTSLHENLDLLRASYNMILISYRSRHILALLYTHNPNLFVSVLKSLPALMYPVYTDIIPKLKIQDEVLSIPTNIVDDIIYNNVLLSNERYNVYKISRILKTTNYSTLHSYLHQYIPLIN
ncbi:Hypothetical protein ORPV_771 [Orpheovirus IHUMI-LCC2]|uniref:Uncharacterized protein n=1 Tax=Orpheovirus IHUMI-LCC2 TaxID=2023057 RepID=A0A2I2L544_9VIRU|nr:Hypothetical protein ORPV_771 [Orpheovirus IHUMI-LCC2]SNW62675.1 Hypothetical protein ORPV_771 [Orpheovirus IHUMI-LCC2]